MAELSRSRAAPTNVYGYLCDCSVTFVARRIRVMIHPAVHLHPLNADRSRPIRFPIVARKMGTRRFPSRAARASAITQLKSRGNGEASVLDQRWLDELTERGEPSFPSSTTQQVRTAARRKRKREKREREREKQDRALVTDDSRFV